MAPPASKKPPKKLKLGKPPPIDKLIIPAVGIGLALMAYQFIRGLTSEIKRVNVSDEAELREVLFGEGGTGKSYAVLCQAEDSKARISSVFQDAYNARNTPAEFRVLDCDHILPESEKSIADRFKLDTKIRPTIFVSGTVGEPQQVPGKHLKTGDMLAKALRGKLGLTAAKIETTQDLRTKCLDKDICGLLLKGSKKVPTYVKDTMNKLIEEFPKVAFASIDSSVLYLKNVEEFLPELEDDQPRFVVFKKVSGSTKTDGDRLKTSIAALKTSGVPYGYLSNLLAGVVRNTEPTTKIAALPVVKTRTKKLVEEEKAMRQRRLDQQRRQYQQQQEAQQGQDGATGDDGAANDGTRDGRRAERERRRVEHLQKNMVRERTPEELAELERRRRERMEEEAAKWNMAPDDAPDAGDPRYDSEPMGDFLDEEESTVTEEVDTAGNEKEDVIDLD